jgi:HemY protein
MRFALWLMALFAVATAGALFAGNNHGTVTLFWAPYRVDLSLNLVLLGLLVLFVVLHLALRAIGATLRLPLQARRWRLQQRERAIYSALLDSLSHLVSGRFIRARKAAELVASLETAVAEQGEVLAHAGRLRSITHLLAAESAHALQDKTVRDLHFQQALQHASHRDAQDVRDGVQLRAARWSLDDRDASAALEWLNQLPQGAGRRTLALRMRFKAARLAGQNRQALDVVRLLTKHRAFSESAGKSIARGLALELVRAAHDPVQLQRAWEALDISEQQIPDVAMEASQRLLALGGEAILVRQWLLPVWNALTTSGPETLTLTQRVRLARVLEQSFGEGDAAPDGAWLGRIEAAQLANPRDAVLQYLAGVTCMRLQLWGKAQQLLKQSLSMLQDTGLKRDAWRALAEMAEQRQDTKAATEAYREALKLPV